MKKHNNFRLFIVVCVAIAFVGIVALVVTRIIQANKGFETLPTLQVHKVNSISSEDSVLFSDPYLAKLKISFGWKDIYRQVTFMQLNQQYQVIMAKDTLLSNALMGKLVHLKKGFGGGTTMTIYKPQPLKDHGEFDFRLEPLQPVDNVFLTYSGGNAEVPFSSDSVVHYRLSCTNVSLRYSPDSAADIYLTSGDESSNDANLHLDIIIAKRFNTIYFLFIVPINYKSPIDPILAKELLK
jgi:hypothetical protein